MSQCNLHFGDPTAHATVKWFFRSLAEERWFLSESLCKELNVVRFVDCMREQVAESRDLFQSIEDIAAKELEEGRYKDVPHFSVLLFSIAWNSLVSQSKDDQECAKSTSLYRVAEEIYDHFKGQSDSYESCSHVFKTGFQLAHFQADDEWHREHTAFKERHYEELRKCRLHYYSVDNPTDFARHVIEHRKRIGPVAEEFKALESEFRALNPLSLDIPIRAGSTRALEFANEFVQNLEDTEKRENSKRNIVTKFAKEFRIVQWEILVRNLIEETKGELSFYPVTDARNVSGIPEFNFLSDFIQNARKVERDFISLYGEILTKKHNANSLTAGFLLDNKSLENNLKACHKSFYTLLPRIPKHFAFVHKDLVSSFVNMRQDASKRRDADNSSNAESSSNVMLIKDGEFSFFSLLWFLRYACSHDAVKCWYKRYPKMKLRVRFRPGFHHNGKKLIPISSEDDWSPSEDDWSACDIVEFAEELGLIIRLPGQKCIPTRRWQSLITWLRRLNKDLTGPPEVNDGCLLFQGLDKKLPVKALDYDEKQTSFVEKLWKFLTSDKLKHNLDKLGVFLSGSSMSCEDFAEKQLGCLIESLDSLLDLGSSDPVGLDDVLLRCCRGFVPLEHLFRAYQPCQLHVLLLALNWEKSTFEKQGLTPTSISGTTIAGRVQMDQNSTDGLENFLGWVTPYWSLFSSLSSQFTLPALQEDSKLIGVQTGTRDQRTHFAHQTAGLLDTIWVDRKREELNFASQFALWLARTEVTDLWGAFDIDTTVPIYEEAILSGWEKLDMYQIVDELVDLGLRGGIRRSLKASDKPKLVAHAQSFYRNLRLADNNNNLEAAKQVFSEVRKSLSFFYLRTDIPPPEWVTTKAFAMCFYHGLRQATYHALNTSVLMPAVKQEEISCLWIDWNFQSVSIFNRGKVDPEVPPLKDRGFFDRFEEKTNWVFKIDGPKPAADPDTWQMVIEKE